MKTYKPYSYQSSEQPPASYNSKAAHPNRYLYL